MERNVSVDTIPEEDEDEDELAQSFNSTGESRDGDGWRAASLQFNSMTTTFSKTNI